MMIQGVIALRDSDQVINKKVKAMIRKTMAIVPVLVAVFLAAFTITQTHYALWASMGLSATLTGLVMTLFYLRTRRIADETESCQSETYFTLRGQKRVQVCLQDVTIHGLKRLRYPKLAFGYGINMIDANVHHDGVGSVSSSSVPPKNDKFDRALLVNLDPDGTVTFASDTTLALFDTSIKDLDQGQDRWFKRVFGTTRTSLLDEITEDYSAHRVVRIGKSANAHIVFWAFEAVFDASMEIELIIASGHEITRFVDDTSMPARAEYIDYLTGLLNQQGLFHHLETSDATMGVTVFLDIDGFTRVNDYFGHAFGDDVLRSIGERLCRLGDGDVIASRFSADKFLVVFLGDAANGDVHVLVDHVLQSMPKHIGLNGTTMELDAHIGYAVYPDDASTLEATVSLANLAMQGCRKEGQRICRYHADMSRQVSLRMERENALRNALDEGSIAVHFQEIVHAANNDVAFVEQLARFSSPALSDLHVEDVFALAKSANLLARLDRYMIEKSLEQFALLRKKARYKRAVLGLNITPETFMDSRGLSHLNRAVKKHHLKRSWISIEVSESTFVGALERCVESINRYKAAGYLIALDDFGREYSSLAVLDSVSFDIVKIDGVFTASLDNMRSREIVKMVHKIVTHAGKVVVAEGVETEAQKTALLGLGCTIQQGYLWHRPESIDTK